MVSCSGVNATLGANAESRVCGSPGALLKRLRMAVSSAAYCSQRKASWPGCNRAENFWRAGEESSWTRNSQDPITGNGFATGSDGAECRSLPLPVTTAEPATKFRNSRREQERCITFKTKITLREGGRQKIRMSVQASCTRAGAAATSSSR